MKKILLILYLFIMINGASALASEPLERYLTSPDLKRVWRLLEAEKFSAASAMRVKFQNDKASLSIYHFLFAKVLANKRRYLDAIDNYGMAGSALASVKPEDAADFSKQIVEVSMLERAHLYYRIEYYYEAYAVYSLFLRNYPSSKFIDKAYVGIAECLIEMGRQREAFQYIEHLNALQGDKQPPSADKSKSGADASSLQYIKANIYQSLGDTKSADPLYKNAIQVDKTFLDTSDSTKYYYGENLRLSGDPTLAKRYLNQVFDKPFVYKAAISIGLISLDEDNTYIALQNFNKSLGAVERNIKKDASVNIAKTYMKDKKPILARPFILKALELNPTQDEKDSLNFLLIKTYRFNGEYEHASQMLKDFIANHGLTYNGVLEEVEALLQDVKDKGKDKFLNIWKTFGYIFLDNKDMKVLNMAKEALKGSGAPYNDLLLWLSNNGSDEIRADCLKELAETKALSGDHEGVLSFLNKLKKVSGTEDWMTRMEAVSYYLAKQNAMAFSMLKNIKILNQKDFDMIRETFVDMPDLKNSTVFFEDIVQKRGGSVADYLRLADVYYFNLKNNDKALKYYQLALKAEPGNGWASYMMAILSNNIEEAKKMYEKISGQNSVYGKLAATILQQNITTKSVSEAQ